jgi:hypothetical protein
MANSDFQKAEEGEMKWMGFYGLLVFFIVSNALAHETKPSSPFVELPGMVHNPNDLLIAPEITWEFRQQIIDAVSRKDVNLTLDSNIELLTRMYPWFFSQPTGQRQIKNNEEQKQNVSRNFSDFAGFVESLKVFRTNTDRIKVLVAIIQTTKDPQALYDSYKELISIDRSHPAFQIEGKVEWKLIDRERSCLAVMK